MADFEGIDLIMARACSVGAIADQDLEDFKKISIHICYTAWKDVGLGNGHGRAKLTPPISLLANGTWGNAETQAAAAARFTIVESCMAVID